MGDFIEAFQFSITRLPIILLGTSFALTGGGAQLRLYD